MRTKVIQVFPETALERILDALERELIEASDADILEAALGGALPSALQPLVESK